MTGEIGLFSKILPGLKKILKVYKVGDFSQIILPGGIHRSVSYQSIKTRGFHRGLFGSKSFGSGENKLTFNRFLLLFDDNQLFCNKDKN